uniref:Uncharacterized protein n=1 Tax=Rhizophora mucronata TaxID=61149 RepID=A0A2P2P1U7_RHIMU
MFGKRPYKFNGTVLQCSRKAPIRFISSIAHASECSSTYELRTNNICINTSNTQ